MNRMPKLMCETTFEREFMADRTAFYLWEVLGVEVTTQEAVRFEPGGGTTTFVTVRAATTPTLFHEAIDFASEECEAFDGALADAGL
jgi:hypothetical protein